MAFLVYSALAHLALVALFAKSPEKIATEGTECWLSEEFCDKLVSLDLVHFVVFNGTSASCNAASAEAEIVTVTHRRTFAFAVVTHLDIEVAGRSQFQPNAVAGRLFALIGKDSSTNKKIGQCCPASLSWPCASVQKKDVNKDATAERYIDARVPLDDSRFAFLHQLHSFSCAIVDDFFDRYGTIGIAGRRLGSEIHLQ